MRVAADIVEHLLRTGKRRFRIHHPLRPARRLQMIGKDLMIGEGLERRAEPQLACVKRVLQVSQEQTAEETRQDPDRQKEAGSAGDPAGAVDREAAAGDHAMEMRMESQRLSPRVQHGEEPDLGAQAFGVGGDGAEGLGYRLEQDAVDDGFVLIRDFPDLFGDGEDRMEVLGVEDVRWRSLIQAARARLAPWTVTAPARVEPDARVAAGVALFRMAAQSGGPTPLDRGHHAAVH